MTHTLIWPSDWWSKGQARHEKLAALLVNRTSTSIKILSTTEVNHFLKNHFNSFSFKRELDKLDSIEFFRWNRCLEKSPKALIEGGHRLILWSVYNAWFRKMNSSLILPKYTPFREFTRIDSTVKLYFGKKIEKIEKSSLRFIFLLL
jgi:hypothetical protein